MSKNRNYSTKSILKHLILAFPKMQEKKDFNSANPDDTELLNKLFELSQRDLIKATFMVSGQRETYGEPLEVRGIAITKKGREYMENKKQDSSVVQNINIGTVNAPLNIAGNTIEVASEHEANKIIIKLLDNIEKSNLPENKKSKLTETIKSMVIDVSAGVLAALITTSASS